MESGTFFFSKRDKNKSKLKVYNEWFSIRSLCKIKIPVWKAATEKFIWPVSTRSFFLPLQQDSWLSCPKTLEVVITLKGFHNEIQPFLLIMTTLASPAISCALKLHCKILIKNWVYELNIDVFQSNIIPSVNKLKTFYFNT